MLKPLTAAADELKTAKAKLAEVEKDRGGYRAALTPWRRS
jgi:hypothetical protein